MASATLSGEKDTSAILIGDKAAGAAPATLGLLPTSTVEDMLEAA